VTPTLSHRFKTLLAREETALLSPSADFLHPPFLTEKKYPDPVNNMVFWNIIL
jgi:hypothetical protein